MNKNENKFMHFIQTVLLPIVFPLNRQYCDQYVLSPSNQAVLLPVYIFLHNPVLLPVCIMSLQAGSTVRSMYKVSVFRQCSYVFFH